MEVAAFWADVPNVAAKEDIDVPALIAYARGEDNVVPLDDFQNPRRRPGPNRTLTPSPSPSNGEGSDGGGCSRSSPLHFVERGRLGGEGWRRGLLAAASLAMAAAGPAWWYVAQGDMYRTHIGEQQSVLLEDGSTVELNAKSRLRVRFSDKARNIELLAGQALFRVAKDPLRPFVVSSGDASVRAVGTRFDVYRKGSGTTVTVLEGRVAVSSLTPKAAPLHEVERGGGEGVLLSAGEQIVVSPKTAALPKPADIPAATAWTQRQIVFQGTPLGEVVEEFNRYNVRQMEVLDESLQGVRVSGVFSSTEPASLLRFLREQVQLEVVEGEERVRISRR